MYKPHMPLYRDTNLQVVFTVTLMGVLGVSSITPAFPKIVQEFQISSKEVGLLITVFTLPGIFLAPLFGVLADRMGRRKILIPSLILFAGAGTACGLVHTFHLLLILRALQGMGTASLGSLNVTIIGDMYTGKERTAAMGYNASVLSVGTAVYPAIGGALATFGWFYPFFLPAAAFPVGLAVLYILDNPEPTQHQVISTYMKTVARALKNIQIIVLFCASMVTFIMVYGAYLMYVPFLVEDLGSSSLVTGAIMAVMSVATAIASSQLGKLVKIVTEKTLIKAAFVLYFTALIMIPLATHVLWLLIPSLVFGVAQGINVPSIQTVLARLAPLEERGAFMSLNGMALRMGQTLGPFLMGIVVGLYNIESVFVVGAFFSVGMMAVAVAGIR